MTLLIVCARLVVKTPTLSLKLQKATNLLQPHSCNPDNDFAAMK
jgi:hypothetical protein